MRISFLALFSLFLTAPAYAGFLQYFKDEDGRTKWQYVANFSSSVLILCLTVALITLFFAHRRKVKANRELQEIKRSLEERVLERTATLDNSNRMLMEANSKLENEIEDHKKTGLRLQSSEAYISNILHSMPSMLIGLDEELNVTQWNRSAVEITGIEYDKALGSNLWDVYPTITITPDQIKEVLISGVPSNIQHSQRGQYYFDIRIFPLQGQLIRGVVILVENVTKKTLAENMLIQRDKMSSMGELASTMATDIKLPLEAIDKDITTIKSKISTLKEDCNVDLNIGELISDASMRSKQVSAVIENLLAFSRSHGDEKSLVAMPDIVNHAIELANTTLSDPKGLRFQEITIDRKFEENLPQIPCYASEMQQVFLSLFRHCVHALALKTESYTPTITIEISECYDALWMKVSHNGVGLTPEEQQNLFEPFFSNLPLITKKVQAENRLSFTHFILTDHHQGQVAITSDVNVGTTFHIQLQLK